MFKALPSIVDIFKLQKRVLVHKIKCRDIGQECQRRGGVKRGSRADSKVLRHFHVAQAFDGTVQLRISVYGCA